MVQKAIFKHDLVAYIVIFYNLNQFVAESFFIDVFIMEGKPVKVKLCVNYHFPGKKVIFFVIVVWPEYADTAKGIFTVYFKEMAKCICQAIVYHIDMGIMSDYFCKARAINCKGIHVIVMVRCCPAFGCIRSMLHNSDYRKAAFLGAYQRCEFPELLGACNKLSLIIEPLNVCNADLMG